MGLPQAQMHTICNINLYHSLRHIIISREKNILIISLCKSKLEKHNLFHNLGINDSETIENWTITMLLKATISLHVKSMSLYFICPKILISSVKANFIVTNKPGIDVLFLQVIQFSPRGLILNWKLLEIMLQWREEVIRCDSELCSFYIIWGRV